MITAEQRARIRRLFFAEHWTVGTIAAELGVHHDTVELALETHRFDSRSAHRPSVLDPYKSLIVATLEQHPRLRATRLFEMVRARGYAGGVVVVRRYVRQVRPARGQKRTCAWTRWRANKVRSIGRASVRS